MRFTKKPYKQWRKMFALFPVSIGNQWVWLEWYEYEDILGMGVARRMMNDGGDHEQR